MEPIEEISRNLIQSLHIPCSKHPTKQVEFVCVKADCDDDRLYCATCVFKKSHCSHSECIKDLDEVLNEQRKQFATKGLLNAPYIFDCLNNKFSMEAAYIDIITAQRNVVDHEIDLLIKEITQSLEGVRKSLHITLKSYAENFSKMLHQLEYKISEHFMGFPLGKYSSFDHVLQEYAPFNESSVLQLVDVLLKNYEEQFKTPREIEAAYNNIMIMKEEAPQLDIKRLDTIKTHFNTFKEKLVQLIPRLINNNGEDELAPLYKGHLRNKSETSPKHKDVNTVDATFISPNRTLLRKKSMGGETERGSMNKRSLSSVRVRDPYRNFMDVVQSTISMPPIVRGSPERGMKKKPRDVDSGRNRFHTVEVAKIKLFTSFPTFHSRTILSVVAMKGTLVATSSDDGLIKLWDIVTGRSVKVLKGHSAGVRSLAMMPGGNLVSGSWDKTVKIWETGDLVIAYEGDNKVIKMSDYSKTLRGHLNAVLTVHVLADGKTIASGSSDNQIRLWDSETGKCLKIFNEHSGEILSFACRADSKTLISGSGDRTIKVWDTERKLTPCVETLSGHTGPVWCLKLLSDDCTLVSGSPDKMIKLWNLDKLVCVRTILGHQNHVLNLSQFKDNTLLSCDDEGVIKIWHLATATCMNTIQDRTGPIQAVAVTSDYNIVAGGSEKRLFVWN